MTLVVRILMVFVFALVGFFPNLGASLPQNVIEIEITHSHDHDHEHHHNHASSEAHPYESTPKEHHPDSQHSHVIVIGSGLVFTAALRLVFDETQELSSSFPSSFEGLPPRVRYLGSIFRPPIGA
jgi:ABC-type nickel/cobalt efflux system permease component RcnA